MHKVTQLARCKVETQAQAVTAQDCPSPLLFDSKCAGSPFWPLSSGHTGDCHHPSYSHVNSLQDLIKSLQNTTDHHLPCCRPYPSVMQPEVVSLPGHAPRFPCGEFILCRGLGATLIPAVAAVREGMPPASGAAGLGALMPELPWDLFCDCKSLWPGQALPLTCPQT